MRHEPRNDSRGILDPDRLRREVRFRRHLAAVPLRRYVEHYWFVDWALTEPFEQRTVPHPAVNVVFQLHGDGSGSAEVAGVGQRLFSITLAGVGRVCGVQFRPGGFRPFWKRPVAELTDRRIPLLAPSATRPPLTGRAGPRAPLAPPPPPAEVCGGSDDDRCRALDDILLGWRPEPDPLADEAMRLADEIRTDRTVRRVDDLARRHDVSTRRLQRLFLGHVGVGPKWVIRRYRLQEAIERAATEPPDWAELAADLGFSDQAHLVREFTAVTGVSPTAYVRSLERPPGR